MIAFFLFIEINKIVKYWKFGARKWWIINNETSN